MQFAYVFLSVVGPLSLALFLTFVIVVNLRGRKSDQARSDEASVASLSERRIGERAAEAHSLLKAAE